MGFKSSLLGLFAQNNSALGWTSETNALSIFNVLSKSKSGEVVTPNKSKSLSAYYACIRNISEDIAKLPIFIYEDIATGGKKRLSSDSVDLMFRRQGVQEMTPFTIKETVTAGALGWGNGYAEILRDNRGKPVGLQPIHPSRVEVKRTEENEIVYLVYPAYNFSSLINKYVGEPVLISKSDMFHIKGLSEDGYVGQSIASVGAESIGTALATQNFGGAFFGNGATLGLMLEHPQTLSKEAQERLLESVDKRHSGSKNAFKTGILEEGMKAHVIGVPPKDAQLLEMRNFQVQEIARWFRMQPNKIQDLSRSTFSNVEQLNIDYVTDTLLPWITRWEQEIASKLITSPIVNATFQVKALLRGDQKSRSEYYRTMFNIGAMSINEIRGSEDENPIGPEGNQHYVPLNMEVAGDTEDEKASTNTVEAFTPAINGAVKRINAREVKALERKGEALAESNFYEDQTAFAIESLYLLVETAGRINGKSSSDLLEEYNALSVAIEAYFEARKKYCAVEIDHDALSKIVKEIIE